MRDSAAGYPSASACPRRCLCPRNVYISLNIGKRYTRPGTYLWRRVAVFFVSAWRGGVEPKGRGCRSPHAACLSQTISRSLCSAAESRPAETRLSAAETSIYRGSTIATVRSQLGLLPPSFHEPFDDAAIQDIEIDALMLVPSFFHWRQVNVACRSHRGQDWTDAWDLLRQAIHVLCQVSFHLSPCHR